MHALSARRDAAQQPAAGGRFADARLRLERLLQDLGLHSGDRVAVRLLSPQNGGRQHSGQAGGAAAGLSPVRGNAAQEQSGTPVGLATFLAGLSEVRDDQHAARMYSAHCACQMQLAGRYHAVVTLLHRHRAIGVS